MPFTVENIALTQSEQQTKLLVSKSEPFKYSFCTASLDTTTYNITLFLFK